MFQARTHNTARSVPEGHADDLVPAAERRDEELIVGERHPASGAHHLRPQRNEAHNAYQAGASKMRRTLRIAFGWRPISNAVWRHIMNIQAGRRRIRRPALPGE